MKPLFRDMLIGFGLGLILMSGLAFVSAAHAEEAPAARTD